MIALMIEARAVEALERLLSRSGFVVDRVAIAGRDARVGRRSDFRWRWFATRLHTFVVVFVTPELNRKLAEELTAAAQQFAIGAKGGLPRGLQTGTVAITIFVTDQVDSNAREWFTTEPTHRFAALRFPVLLETDARLVTHYRGRMAWGHVYQDHLLRVVADVIEPVVRTHS